MSRPGLTWFKLRFPRDLEADAATAAISTFTGIPYGAKIILDLSATSAGIAHHLAVTSPHRDSIAANLRAAIPSLRLTSTEPVEQDRRRALLQLAPFVASIRSDDLDATAAALLASLFPLGKGELARLRWTLRSGPRPAPGISGDSDLRGGRLKALRAKLGEPGLNVYGELSVRAGSRARRTQLVQRIVSVLRSLSTPYGRVMLDPAWIGQLCKLFYLRGRYVSAPELATLVGWPIGGPDLPGLEVGAAKRLVPSAKLPKVGRVLGVSDFEGFNRPVALSPKAATRGLWMIGATGVGKTNLLKNLILDDLEHGQGVAVLDTAGDLIPELMDTMPAKRLRDVVVIDPTDRDFAVGFNPLASGADPSLIADQLSELFHRLWRSSWGPRVAMLTHMGLLTLARRPGSTLVDLPRLYTDPAFRARVLADVDDPVGLGPDWLWFEGLSSAEQATVISPMLNKVRAFTSRPSIRAIVGQPKPSIGMRQIVAGRKVLLAHLPKGLIGAETAQLLGSLLLIGLWQTMAERASLKPEKRAPFGLWIDEAQDYAHAPVPWDEMTAQGRKYGLALALANQHAHQLPKELREALIANARSKVVFALGPTDAALMEKEFSPALTADDLVALDAYSVAAKISLDDGGTASPVTLTTPPPVKPTGSYEQVKSSSRRRYGRERSTIEDRLHSQAEGRRRTAAAPIGRKKRGSP
ncbi:MAG: type IV secretory system conjugative DNA transfer family protein [Solirubrobacterales bacterium]